MLYLIATPIGNLKDITLRALEVLEKVEILLCEDTRKTGILLKGLNVMNNPKLVSFYDEVEQQKIPQIIEWLKEGSEIGLVTDAGTPLLSDPGWLLVKKCYELGIKYTALPGANAVINAVVLSGLPIQRFCFLGFLPKRSGERKKILAKYREFEGAKVVYESGQRLKELVADIKEIWGEKTEVRVCREMTKIYEEVTEKAEESKGEVVVVFY